MTSDRDLIIDYVRGVAAFMVVLGHVRAMFFGSTPADPGLIESVFYFVSGFATHAVYVFFGLSGYLLGGIAIKNIGSKSGLLQQLVRRLVRLWVVLAPCLLFTLACHFALSPDIISGSFREIWNSGPTDNAPYSVNSTTFLANLFFLNEYIAGSYGINSPLWSLSFEATFYVALFLFFLSFRTWAMVPILISIIFLFAMNPHMIGGALVFSAGAIVKIFFSKRICRTRSLSVILLLCGVLTVSRIYPQLNVIWFVIIGCASVLLIHHCSVEYKISILVWLARVSYSLYVVHFPVIAVVYSCFGVSVGVAFAATLMALLVGYAFWFCFERHTPLIFKKLRV